MSSKVFSPTLQSSLAKLRRADFHREHLQSMFSTFVNENPYRIVVENNPETGYKIVKLAQSDFNVEDFGVVLGDCINNLKCALDHAVFQTAKVAGVEKRLKKVKFASGETRVSFESQCDGFFAEVTWLNEWMKSKEVFRGGKGHNLLVLTQINNVDKHQIIHVVQHATGHPGVTVTYANGSISTAHNNMFVGFRDIVLAEVPPGGSFQINHDEKFAIDVIMPNAGQQSVFNIVSSLSDMVRLTIEELDAVIVKNT